VKPQFEGTPKEVPGGAVRDEATRQAILARVLSAAEADGFRLAARVDASLRGRSKGNLETFYHLVKHP
jgi:predicted rRNA methylase YqxC with S4 and FtsJ domains